MSSTPSSSLRSNHASDSVSPGGLAVFRHPAAEHEIRLGQSLVAFELKRCKRRSIGMVVSPEGLSVRAPRWATWSDIEQALQDKSRWICGKLVDQRDRGHKVAAARIISGGAPSGVGWIMNQRTFTLPPSGERIDVASPRSA